MNGSARLKLARVGFFSGGGFTGSYTSVAVKVRNLAFAKTVTLHYTTDNATWKDSAAIGFKGWYGDYDLFEGTVNEQVKQFVVRYDVGGQTSWDNNGGGNYHLQPEVALVGRNVALHRAVARVGQQAGGGLTFTTSWLEGEILINDLAFPKDVGIRLSVDGGATWSDVLATFVGEETSDQFPLGPTAEAWTFKTPELNVNGTPEFRFAVFYRNVGTGETYWDNNFGQDYKLSKADGTTIR